jgi:CMP/dCMP kinase
VSSLLVAIDGAAGSGKSTLARGLASALDLPYVNTGLMYRALTLAAIRAGTDTSSGEALAALMKTLRFTLSEDTPSELVIDIADSESPTTDDLSSEQVEGSVSEVSRHAEVRTLMRDAQRRLAGRGAVMEGRDIATVVLPEAQVKIYLVADAEVRADRRAEERQRAHPEALHERDRKDATVNPFAPAPDAVLIDTTDLDVEGTVGAALGLVRERWHGER